MPQKRWTEDDVILALFLRHCGLNDADIGAELGRTASSIGGKIGHARKSNRAACINTSAMVFEAVRPMHAVLLGRRADEFPTMGSA